MAFPCLELSMLLSFVIPVYNSESTIEEVVRRIINAVKEWGGASGYEIVLVNDCSRDGSAAACRRAVKKYPHVRFVNLSRNFGQANAVLAGFHRVKGDIIIALDDDLQTPPEEFSLLVDKLVNNNLDVVYGTYEVRHKHPIRAFGSKVNQYMQNTMLSKPKHVRTSSYFAVRRFVVDEAVKFTFPDPYLPGLFFRVTSRVDNVLVKHHSRVSGQSGYNFTRLLSLWFNGLIEFSQKPLGFAGAFGMGVTGLSVLVLLIQLIRKLITPNVPVGFMGPFIMLFAGVQMVIMGILGQYVGRLLMGMNQTPQFVVRDEQEHQDTLAAPAGDGAGATE